VLRVPALLKGHSIFHSPYVVVQIFKRPNPCYHYLFLYDDADDTVGCGGGSTAKYASRRR
jgi:hypothetical protein